MSEQPKTTTRRDFLRTTGGLAVAASMPGFRLPNVHPSGDETIHVALVGCGGRGTSAAFNALSTKHGPTKLVAMADVFQDRLSSSYDQLAGSSLKEQVDVPADRRFLGFDGYKKAMDALRPGDVVILTTPPAFRWPHFQYAIAKKLNVFMEKPVTVDGPTSKRMLKLGEEASAAGLKVGVGLMSRHAKWLQELHARVQDGEIGDVLFMRGYRMHGPTASFESKPKPDNISHLEYQIRRFHSFLWCSGGCFNDFYIHHVDHLCWMKNAWPVSAQAVGGRHYRTTPNGEPLVDQNLDSYAVEYTFDDGTKFIFEGRCIDGAHGIYSSYLHGSKGMAIAARSGDCNGPSSTYRGQKPVAENMIWQSTDRTNPYQEEWEVLMDAIRRNKPYNEVERGVEASLVSSMGRMAAHTGQLITHDAMLNCEHEFAPSVDKLTYESDAPLMPDASGRYPVPRPGWNPKTEF
jgi:predicted dehydrogenase